MPGGGIPKNGLKTGGARFLSNSGGPSSCMILIGNGLSLITQISLLIESFIIVGRGL